MASPTINIPNLLPLTAPDLVCEVDLDPLARETINDLQNLEQDVLHILRETYGSNLDDINRGIGVISMLSGTTAPLATIANVIETQLVKDSRIDACKATLSQDGPGDFTLIVQVQVAAEVIGLSYSYNAINGLTVTP